MVGIQTEVAIAWPISLFSSTDTQARTPVSYIYLACRFSLTSVTQTCSAGLHERTGEAVL